MKRRVGLVILLVANVSALADVTTIGRVRASGDVAVAGDGTLYLSDFGPPNQANGSSIDRLTIDGSIDTFVSGLGRALEGNAVDSAGNLIQVGFNSDEIYRIDPTGNVTTLASLDAPVGVAVDEADTIYLTQCRTNAILRLESDGSLTTLASGGGLNCPNGLDVGHDGALYVVNNADGEMLRVGLDGSVSTFATIPGGGNGHVVFVGGFYYVAGRLAHRIFQVDRDGNVAPYAGTGVDGETDGANLEATISRPNGIDHSPDGRFLYVIGSSDFSAADLPVRRIDLPAGTDGDFAISAALTGAWFDPATAGQGFMLDVIPSTQQIALAWFTYSAQPATGNAAVGVDGHEWLTAQGPYAQNTAELTVTLTTGGIFDDPNPVSNESAGSITLTFQSCSEATLAFTLDDGRTGSISLERLTPASLCEAQPVTQKSTFNQPPALTNLMVSRDGSTLLLDFDLSDRENDGIEVTVNLVNQDGSRQTLSTSFLSGAVGYPVPASGTQRIAWRFADDPAYAALGGQPFRLEVVADDRFVAGLQDIVDLVDEERLVADVAFMQRGVRHFSAGPAHLEATRDYLRAEMTSRGLPISEQRFFWQGDEGVNVIATLEGRDGAEDYFIVDGHYDTVSNSPGADDNASGTAGMLEAMRVLSQFNTTRSIRFVGFDKEELGLRGARHYVARKPASEKVLGLINFEMIGYTCRGQAECASMRLADTAIYNIHSNFADTMANTFFQIGRDYVPGLKIETVPDDGDPNLRRSDHAPFWDIGVDALFLTDGANFRTPHYHQPSDRLDVMDVEFMTQVVKTAVGTLATMSGATHTDQMVSEVLTVAR